MKYRFNMWMRVVCLILAAAFIWQDIVWAYPELITADRATLAPQTLATTVDYESAFKRVALAYIPLALKANADQATLNTVKSLLKKLQARAENTPIIWFRSVTVCISSITYI